MKKYIFVVALLSPTVVFAQVPASTIGNTIAQVSALVQYAVSLLLSVTAPLFLWGIVKFIANIGDEGARKAGKHLMVWDIVALFVMVSSWGIIGYVQQSLGLSGQPVIVGSASHVPSPIPSY